MTNSNSSADDAGATFSASLLKYQQERLKRVRSSLPILALKLQALKVATIHVAYDGCGDSGQIESIEYFDSNGGAIEVAGSDDANGELADLFYDLSQARHMGWENNDGAFGTFVWNLADLKLHHSHSTRFTDVETTEQEGL